MPPFRNLLNRKPATTLEEAAEPTSANNENLRPSLDSQGSGALSFRKSREEVPNEYKLSGASCDGGCSPPGPRRSDSRWEVS